MFMKKAVMTTIGIFIVILMLIFAFTNNFNVGVIIPMAFGVVIALWCYVPDNNIVKVLKRVFAVGSAVFIIFMVLIGFMAQTNAAEFNEDAVIVLGCGLHGSIPSKNLADRLEKAVEYSEKNENAIIVVSGGQGPQEDCTEAEAMYKYLVNKGIDKNKIIMEDRATSTNENYKYSKEILDGLLGENYKTVYITNSFHSYRAGRLAELNGIDANAYSAGTSIPSLIPNYCREVLAVIQLWIFNK